VAIERHGKIAAHYFSATHFLKEIFMPPWGSSMKIISSWGARLEVLTRLVLTNLSTLFGQWTSLTSTLP